MHVTFHAASRLSQLAALPPQLHHLIDIHCNHRCFSSSSSSRYAHATADGSSSSSAHSHSSSSTPYTYPSHSRPTPHQIFHLPYGASQKDIKARYYELVRIHHPDSHASRTIPPNIAQHRFQSITAAYDILRGKAPHSSLHSHSHSPFSRGDPYAEEIRRRKAAFRRQAEWQRAQASGGMAGMGPEGWDATRNSDDRWKDRLIVIAGIITLAAGLSPGFFYGRMMEERHLSAVFNLSQARNEAKECGEQRRKELKRRVSEFRLIETIEREEEIRERRKARGSSDIHGVDIEK